MDFTTVFQSVLAIVVGAFGFFFKRFSDSLEEGSRRMGAMERELTRQQQQAVDLDHRLQRIEDKIDRLLSA